MRAELERMRSINEVYDAVAARGCVDAYTAVVKGCRDGREIGSACRFIFAGTLMPGQTCMSTSECTPGASCQRPRDGGTSQCTNSTPAHGQPGESCSATCTFIESSATTTCSGGGQGGSGGGGSSGPANCFTNDGLYCDAMHLCAMMPALNQPCTVGTPCAGDAFCDNGVCAAKRTAGSCGQNNDGCAAAAYCDAARQCQLRKSTGAACTTTNECATTDTCSNGTCRARTIATARSCMGNL